jgi:hypothetical protein
MVAGRCPSSQPNQRWPWHMRQASCWFEWPGTGWGRSLVPRVALSDSLHGEERGPWTHPGKQVKNSPACSSLQSCSVRQAARGVIAPPADICPPTAWKNRHFLPPSPFPEGQRSEKEQRELLLAVEGGRKRGPYGPEDGRERGRGSLERRPKPCKMGIE